MYLNIMWNIRFGGVAMVIIPYLFMKNISSQPYFYEEDKTFYPDSSSANEMYNLDQVEHDQDGSMRALAGVIPENDVATVSYYDEIQNSDTDSNTDSSELNKEEAFIDNNKNNFKDGDVITGELQNKDLQYEDPSINNFKSAKQNDSNVHAQFQEERSVHQSDSTPYKEYNFVKQSDKITERPHNKSLTGYVTYGLREYPPQTSISGQAIAEDTSNTGSAYNGTMHRNSLTAFSGQIKQKNDSMIEVTATNSSICDPKTHSGCDVIHFERCDPETSQCRCLNGYLPENSALRTGSCRAVSFYHGHIKVPTSKPSQRFSNEQMLSLKQRLAALIGRSLKRQGLDAVLDLNIRSVETKDHHTSLTFEVGLNKDVISGDKDLQSALRHDIVVMSQGEFLMDILSEHFTSELNGSWRSLFPALVQVNPCISQDHNHCSQHASCKLTDASVSCQCKPGYEDLTPNLYRLHGEVCVEKCKCHYGGICIDADDLSGAKQCSCLKWYFGSECQIDGKELLLICCCSLGCIVLLGLTTCCCYYGCIRHRDNVAKSSMFSFSPDINILKLPRVWMDTTGYNDHELSPPDPRRMSFSSDRNPYFDGYIMEDVSLGTLQRDRDSQSAYYQVSQTSLGHCPATMSSHSFYRY